MDFPLTYSMLVILVFHSHILQLVFGRFVLGYKPRKAWIALSFLPFVPLWIFYHLRLAIPLIVGLILTESSLVFFRKKALLNSKYSQLSFVESYVNCTLIMVLNVIWTIVGVNHSAIERTCVTIVSLIWIGVFHSPLRHKLRDLVAASPKSVLNVSVIIFTVMTVVNIFAVYHTPFSELKAMAGSIGPNPSDAESMRFLEMYWDFVTQIMYVLVELTFLVGLTFYLYYAASYSRVKVLNAGYEQQIQIQADHYKKLADANTEVRRFRHDFKNIRFSIEKLLSEGKNEEALNLMQAFGDTLDAPKRQMLLFDTGNGIADALLTDKLRRAAADNTVVNFSGAIPQNALLPTDLCVLLGNTLDNAIEACQKLPQDSVKAITVKCNCSSGFLFLSICNPIADEVTIMDNRIATTKKDTLLHGFGIQSMHNVAKKYDGSVKLNADNGFFTVNIDLCLLTHGSKING